MDEVIQILYISKNSQQNCEMSQWLKSLIFKPTLSNTMKVLAGICTYVAPKYSVSVLKCFWVLENTKAFTM